jgi:hypothetical protein
MLGHKAQLSMHWWTSFLSDLPDHNIWKKIKIETKKIKLHNSLTIELNCSNNLLYIPHLKLGNIRAIT